MICPKCKTENRFKVDKSSIYCIAKINDELCGYTLTKEEKDNYRIEQLSLTKKTNFKIVKRVGGCTVKQIALLNEVHRNTVRKHIDEFDVIPFTKPTRYKFNKKIFKENWKSIKEKDLEKYIPTINFFGYEIILDKTDLKNKK